MSTTTSPNRKLQEILAPYRSADRRRSLSQLISSALGFALTWVAMFYSLRVGYWLTLLLALPAAGFLLRLFMIQHDCGHGSFFKSQRINNVVGFIIGVLTLVPYNYWRRTHAMHHKTSGDLDFRSFGDINTLTVKEYLARTKLKRLGYRIYRNPFIMLGVGPAYQFVLKHRYPWDIPRTWKREWASVHGTNLALLAIVLVMWQTIGIGSFLAVQIPITLIAGSVGVWLFYMQHQFEDTYWKEHKDWDFFAAGLQGSSHYALPKILQWFTANIGFHHIHHVSSKIPNYRLPECFAEHSELRRVTSLTLRQSLGCVRLALWDEEHEKLIRFRDVKKLVTQAA